MQHGVAMTEWLKGDLLNIDLKVSGCCSKFVFYVKSAAEATSVKILLLLFLKLHFYVSHVFVFIPKATLHHSENTAGERERPLGQRYRG